jgi:hypothetical protein
VPSEGRIKKATVRGAPGQIIGIGTLAWTADDATMTIGILAPDVLQAPTSCNSPATAESLVAIDDPAWQQLLTSLGDRVRHEGGT